MEELKKSEDKKIPRRDFFCGPISELKGGDEENGQGEAEDAAGQGFGRFVAHPFLEARIVRFGRADLVDDHIDVAAVFAHIDAQPGGVVDDQNCHYKGDGEGSGTEAFEVADGSHY